MVIHGCSRTDFAITNLPEPATTFAYQRVFTPSAFYAQFAAARSHRLADGYARCDTFAIDGSLFARFCDPTRLPDLHDYAGVLPRAIAWAA